MNNSTFHDVNQTSLLKNLATSRHIFEAWRKVRSLKTSPGPDGITCLEFDRHLEEYLASLTNEIRSGKYQPGSVKIVNIWNRHRTKTRKIGIMNLRDRVIHRALHDLLDPLLDPMMLPCSYAFRKGVSIGQALMRVRELTKGIFNWVIGADIEKCFESVCHAPLKRRLFPIINDQEISELIQKILEQWSESLNQKEFGILQGSPLSPLLSNFYLDALDQHVVIRNDFHFVRFCDDFVMFGRSYDEVTKALACADEALESLGMSLKTPKIRLACPGEKFHFLGMDFRLSTHREKIKNH